MASAPVLSSEADPSLPAAVSPSSDDLCDQVSVSMSAAAASGISGDSQRSSHFSMSNNASLLEALPLANISRQLRSEEWSHVRRVALQMPDCMLSLAPSIVAILERFDGDDEFGNICSDDLQTAASIGNTNGVKRQYFVLGDTSYGSCCADEVAAAHADAEILVHFGRSCLSRPSRIPVLLAFGQSLALSGSIIAADNSCEPASPAGGVHSKLEALVAAIHGLASSAASTSALLIIIDQPFSHVGENLRLRVEGDSCKVFVGLPPLTRRPLDDSQGSSGDRILNERVFSVCGFEFTGLDRTALPFSMSESDIVWVGTAGRAFTNLVFSMSRSCRALYSFDPSTESESPELVEFRPSSTNRQLMRRYYLVQRAREASVFGVLVGTLGVARYRAAMAHCQDLLRLAGKKFYTIAVGKVNVPKLANFSAIECFVSVSCPLTSVALGENVDEAREYLAPIITPFELEIALRKGVEWTGHYETDFTNILINTPRGVDVGRNKSQNEEEDDEEEEAMTSLVSGRTISNPKHVSNQSSTTFLDGRATGSSSALMVQADAKDITTWSPAAAQLANQRSWKGLEPRLGETSVKLAEEGTSGIPMGYSNEKN